MKTSLVMWRVIFTILSAVTFGWWFKSIAAGLFMFFIILTYKQLED